ncbi:outer membrane beta-barrel protein [Ferruginibacter sp. SUN002]|uniref:outer membrane beta-barrel protein n=1 Tax=Ferruginibacter sp. SUN002 TaxID=2937789 RepID=UPI003D359C9F
MIILKKAVIIIICLTNTMFALSQRTWYVGLHINPGTYQLYNKNDWNADSTLIYPVTGKLNTITIGATTTYIWNKHFGINSGLLYNYCKQEFFVKRHWADPDPLVYYNITDEFNYLKLPINFQYSTNNNAKHQFIGSVGLLTSFLIDYREHFLQKSTGFYSEYEWHNKTGTAISVNNSKAYYDKFIYNRLLLGINSTVSYCLKFTDGWKLKIGIIGEYDFTNAENRKAKRIDNNALFWSTTGIKRYGYTIVGGERPKTHNRSLGIFINASIPISIRE